MIFLGCLFFLSLFGAEGVILINAKTGHVLFEKNADQAFYPASLTKVATALYTLALRGDQLDTELLAEHHHVAWIKDEVKQRSPYLVPSYQLVPGAAHMGLVSGEKMMLSDLLKGMMIASADDAANVIAEYIGGTISNFMEELNEYVKSLGCINTNFTNPHGLHHANHVSTARDLAKLTQVALVDPLFSEMVKKSHCDRPASNKQKGWKLAQTNLLLRRGSKYHYKKAIGVKTGYTSKAGYNLIAAAHDNDRTLIVVLLKCQNRDAACKLAIQLFDNAFNEKKCSKVLVPKGDQEGLYYTKEPLVLEYYPSDCPNIQIVPFFYPGAVVGEYQAITDEGIVLTSVPLYLKKENWIAFLKNKFNFYN